MCALGTSSLVGTCASPVLPASRFRAYYPLKSVCCDGWFNLPSLLSRLRAGRVRILWLVLGALLLVSALPIGLYHRQVLELSQEKLVDTERVQQTELTRSLAQEVQFFESNLTQQLISQRQILASPG